MLKNKLSIKLWYQELEEYAKKFLSSKSNFRGRRGIRTPKGIRQRIYSPPRLSNSGVRPIMQKSSIKYIFLWIKMQVIEH